MKSSNITAEKHSQQFQKLQYRNGIYVGSLHSPSAMHQDQQHKETNCHFGMFLSDFGETIFGEWVDNQLHGKYAYISDTLRAYGTMDKGELDGFNTICSTTPKFKKDHNSKLSTIYGNFKKGKAYGYSMVILQNFIIIHEINEEEQWGEPIQQRILNSHNLAVTLKEYFPYASKQQLPEFINNLINSYNQNTENSKNSIYGISSGANTTLFRGHCRFEPIVKPYHHNHVFYGFIQKYTKTQYGIILRENQIMSMGAHQQGLLHGLGTLFTYNSHKNTTQIKTISIQTSKYDSKDKVMDGVFDQGNLSGIGVCYHPKNYDYLLGNFTDNDQVEILKKGIGWPDHIIKDYRMEFHLRSPQFVSQFLQINPVEQSLRFVIDKRISNNKMRTNENGQKFNGLGELDHEKLRSPQRRFTEYKKSPSPIKKQTNIKQLSNGGSIYKESDQAYFTLKNQNLDGFEIRKRNWTNFGNNQKIKQLTPPKLVTKDQPSLGNSRFQKKSSHFSEIEQLSRNSLYNTNHQRSPKIHKQNAVPGFQKAQSRRNRISTYSSYQ